MNRWYSDLRNYMCARGLHWPIRFDYEATPAYLGDPPTPPEEGWCCQRCRTVRDRGPYRAWIWDLRQRFYWRRRRFCTKDGLS